MTGACGLTVIVSVVVPVPPGFAAPMVTEEVPVAVGVPVIAPVVVLTESPVGSPVAEKLVGLYVAVIV